MTDKVIKQYRPPALEAEVHQDIMDQSRIRRQRVVVPPAEDLDDGFRLHDVIRREQAQFMAVPVQIEDFDPRQPLPTPSAPPTPAGTTRNRPSANRHTAVLPDGITTLDELKEQWHAEWITTHEETLEQRRMEGYRDGIHSIESELHRLEETPAALEAERQEMSERFQNDLRAFHHAWQDTLAQAEPLLTTLALTVAETLLSSSLTDDLKGVATQAVARAIDQLGDDAPLELAVHPVDYMRLQEIGFVNQIAQSHPHLNWHPDSDLELGDWVVQSPTAVIRRVADDLKTHLEALLHDLPHTSASEPTRLPGDPSRDTPPADESSPDVPPTA